MKRFKFSKYSKRNPNCYTNLWRQASSESELRNIRATAASRSRASCLSSSAAAKWKNCRWFWRTVLKNFPGADLGSRGAFKLLKSQWLAPALALTDSNFRSLIAVELKPVLLLSNLLRWVKVKLEEVKTWVPWEFFTADGKKDETEGGGLRKERLWSINCEKGEYAEICL